MVSPAPCRSVGLLFFALMMSGCASLPDDAFRLPETTLEIRQIQTRQFEDVGETEILSASMGVLQDLGYAIDEIEKELGVLSASKRADASDTSEILGRIALDAMSCVVTFLFACDNENYLKAGKYQDIRLTIVVLPVTTNKNSHDVRITMQRVIWDRDGRISGQTTISDPGVYQAFFIKLNKSVFLEKEGA